MKTVAGVVAVAVMLGLVACTAGEDASQPVSDDSDVQSKADCNIQKVLCEITPPRCERGKTPSVRGDCYGPCVEIKQCKPQTFDCDQGGPALCEIVPPRCAAGETLTTQNGCFGPCVPSAVCKGAEPEPKKGEADCDISKVQCEIFPLSCPEGQSQTVDADGFCYGGCVPLAQCKAKSFNCKQGGPALCEIVPPRCAAGETLTTRDGCFGPCVPSAICR